MSSSLRASYFAGTRTAGGGWIAAGGGARLSKSGVRKRWGKKAARMYAGYKKSKRSKGYKKYKKYKKYRKYKDRNPYLKLHITPEAYALKPGTDKFIEYYRVGLKEKKPEVVSDWTAWCSRSRMMKVLNAAASILHGVPKYKYGLLNDDDKEFCRQQYFNGKLAGLEHKRSAMRPGYRAQMVADKVAERSVMRDYLKETVRELAGDKLKDMGGATLFATSKFNSRLLSACKRAEEALAAYKKSKQATTTEAGDLAHGTKRVRRGFGIRRPSAEGAMDVAELEGNESEF